MKKTEQRIDNRCLPGLWRKATKVVPTPIKRVPHSWQPLKVKTPDPDSARAIIESRTPKTSSYTRKQAGRRSLASDASNIVAGPASIAELARALRNNVDLIFEWVYSNIEYTPTYGVQRGALGCLIDGRGNAFDQSMLLVELLTEAGHTCSYVLGDIELPAAVANNWLGTTISPAVVTNDLLEAGGIPCSYTSTSPDNLNKQILTHMWVRVDIGGTWYHFDPSLKEYTYKSGVNLATAMDYNRSTFMSDALSGATSTSDYIVDLNRDNIRGNLDTYSSNLVTWIKENEFAANLDDILGGRTINALSGTVRDTAHPYLKPATTPTTSSSVSNSYKATLQVEVAGIDETFYSDEIYPDRIMLLWNESYEAELYIGGTLVATGTAVTPESVQTVTVTITHNGIVSPNVNQVLTLEVLAQPEFYTHIGQAWGTSGEGTVDYHQALYEANSHNPTTSEPNMGERLAMIWANYNSLSSAACNNIDRMGNCRTSIFHNIGFISYLYSYDMHLDDWGLSFTTSSLEGNSTKAEAVNQACNLHIGTMEALAFSATVDILGVSAASIVDAGIADGTKIYDATSSNWTSTVRPALLLNGYDSGYLDFLKSEYIDNGARLIVPERGNLTVGDFTNPGLLVVQSDGSILHLVGEGYKGGGAGQCGHGKGPKPDPGKKKKTPPDEQSPDPIDLFTGFFLHENLDIRVGSQGYPYELAFIRSYSSGLSRVRLAQGSLGRGWRHNYATSLSRYSDFFRGFGSYSPIDAAPSLVAMFISFDLLNQAPRPLDRWLVTAVGLVWWGDQLWQNAVMVDTGDSTSVFVKLPDGSFNPPPDSADTLEIVNDEEFILTTPQQVEYNFNSDGLVTTCMHPNGVTVTYTYTEGLLTSVSNGMDRTLTISYDGNRVVSVSDGTGRAVSYGYDEVNDNLTSFENADGRVTTYGYVQPGLMSELFRPVNPMDAVVTNEYDSLGRVKVQTAGADMEWSYFFAGSRSEEVDPVGNSTVYQYNPRGLVVKTIDALLNEWTKTLDGRDRLSKMTLPEGNSTEYEYDENHNVITRTYKPKPGSGLSDIVEEFTYDSTFNKVATFTDGRENVTTYTYHPTTGNLMLIERPEVDSVVPEVAFDYNARGQLISRIDETGIQTQWNYDLTTEKLLSVVHDVGTSPHLNLTTEFDYNSRGDVTSVTDSRTNVTTFEFDLQRRCTKKIDPAPFEFETRWTYDFNGKLIKVERETGDVSHPWQTTLMSYTLTGKHETLTDPKSNVTSYEYDDRDRLAKIVDAELRETEFAYDELNRLYTETDPSNVVSRTLTYTDNGLVETIKDGRNNVTEYEFDGFDRMKKQTFPDSSFEEYSSYDENGNLLVLRKRSGDEIDFQYDVLNRMTSKSPDGMGTVSLMYDLAGRLEELSKPVISGDPSTGVFKFYYDTAGRRIKEEYPDSKLIEHQLDENGNVTRIIWPDAYFVDRIYDELNRLTDIKLNGSMSSALEFSYDSLSRRTALVYANGAETAYSYDLANNLEELEQTFDDTSVKFTYGYDAVDQLTEKQVDNDAFMWAPTNNETVSYGIASSLNQYLTVAGDTYSYNDNGCLTDGDIWEFVYDTENEMLSADNGSISAAYVYDPLKRQAQKEVNTTKTRFIYSGWQRIADYDGAGTMLRRFVYGVGLDEPLLELDSFSNIVCIHHEKLGSIIARSDDSGDLLNSYSYSPFGESDNLTVTEFGYTGQRFDAETGLYYYKLRQYSSGLGRFWQPDPIGFSSGDLNLYSYVSNSPLNYRDPVGLTEEGEKKPRKLYKGHVSNEPDPGPPESKERFIIAATDEYLSRPLRDVYDPEAASHQKAAEMEEFIRTPTKLFNTIIIPVIFPSAARKLYPHPAPAPFGGYKNQNDPPTIFNPHVDPRFWNPFHRVSPEYYLHRSPTA